MAKVASSPFALRNLAEKVDKSLTMKNLRTILFLFISLVLLGCQAKQGESDSDLISGHLPTTNSFTLAAMTSKTYLSGEVLNFVVKFPFDMTVTTTGGSPRLRITVGSTTRYTTFVPQGTASELHFTYTVPAGESDLNGIDVNALELNGSTITFLHDGVATNCNVASLTSRRLSGVKVDAEDPTISSLLLTNPIGLYLAGSSINFNLVFTEPVYVTGTPSFKLRLSGTEVDVTYLSGSGSATLAFRYIVGQTVIDTNGYDDIHTLSLPAGAAIKDSVGHDADLTLPAASVATAISNSATVDINGRIPVVTSVDFPPDDTYLAAQNLDFIFEFDRNVSVTGTTTPYLPVTIGSNTRQAQFYSVTNNIVTFRYTTIPGDVAPTGITVPNSLQANGGAISSVAAPVTSFFLNNTYSAPATNGIIISAIQPEPISVTRNVDTTTAVWGTAQDNVWIIGQTLFITVGFNTNIFVNQTNGSPYIPLTIGASTKNATYLSGGDGQTSLVFRYVIEEGDLDVDNSIGLGSIVANNSVIVDEHNTVAFLNLPVASLASTKIDGVRPIISSVTPAPNNTYSNQTDADYQDMIFTVNWSEAVNYSVAGSISMDVGGAATPLVSYANNLAAITHRPTSALSPKNDSDGVTVGTSVTGAVVKDQAGNQATNLTFTALNTSSIFVDTTLPVVSSITPISAASSYKQGETIDFSVTFNESVTVLTNGTYPRIPITVGATTRYMIATTSGTGTTHTFRYTVAAGDNDNNGIASSATVQNSGTTAYVRDAGRNNATTGLAVTFASHLVDTTVPTVSSVAKTANGTYETGDNLDITITYSEPVIVDTTGGTPRIAITVGSTTRYLTYTSGSGTTAILFRYTLVSTDFDVNGMGSLTTISLNGGTIKDAAGNAPVNTFTSQSFATIYAVFANTDLWVESSFVNKAKTGSPAVTNSGAIGTLDTCGTATCRKFDGDGDTLSATISNVQTVFIVFKTPATAFFADRQIFGSDIILNAQANDFDLSTSNSRIILDGGAQQGPASSFPVAMAENSVHVLQVDFSTPQSVSGNLVETGFNGSIAEIWAINGALTTAQKDTIRNYLDGKY